MFRRGTVFLEGGPARLRLAQDALDLGLASPTLPRRERRKRRLAPTRRLRVDVSNGRERRRELPTTPRKRERRPFGGGGSPETRAGRGKERRSRRLRGGGFALCAPQRVRFKLGLGRGLPRGAQTGRGSERSLSLERERPQFLGVTTTPSGPLRGVIRRGYLSMCARFSSAVLLALSSQKMARPARNAPSR